MSRKRQEPQAVLDRIRGLGLVVVFSTPDDAKNAGILRACVKGGANILEFTNRLATLDEGVGRFRALQAVRDAECPNVLLGVGTIWSPTEAEPYVDAGADFVVGPCFNGGLAVECRRRGVLYSPGCQTPTEVASALAALNIDGRDDTALLKVFPAEIVGPGWIRSVLATRKGIQFMPTGGVEPNRESIEKWFGAGVVAVGMGSALIRANDVELNNWQAVTDRVSETLALVAAAKTK